MEGGRRNREESEVAVMCYCLYLGDTVKGGGEGMGCGEGNERQTERRTRGRSQFNTLNLEMCNSFTKS